MIIKPEYSLSLSLHLIDFIHQSEPLLLSCWQPDRGRYLPIMPWNRFVAKEPFSSSSPFSPPPRSGGSSSGEPLRPSLAAPGLWVNPGRGDAAAAGFTCGGAGCAERGGGQQHGRCSREETPAGSTPPSPSSPRLNVNKRPSSLSLRSHCLSLYRLSPFSPLSDSSFN